MMKLFVIISLLFIAANLPLSFGRRCWKCKTERRSDEQCPQTLSLEEEECWVPNAMCVHAEYLKDNSLHYLGCDIYGENTFKKELQCTAIPVTIEGQSNEVNARQCTCGTDLCNNPNKERIYCFSCYGNRKGINGDEPLDRLYSSNTAVTDFVCQAGEVPEAKMCPLDAQVCMIKWNNQHKTIGCSSHRISPGKTFDGYYLNGEGEGYCNTNRCNVDSLKDQLPRTKPTTTTTTTKRTTTTTRRTTTKRTTTRTTTTTTENSVDYHSGAEDSSGNEDTEEEEPSGSGITEEDKSSPSSWSPSLLFIIILVVVAVLVMAICFFAVILIIRRKNNRNNAVMPVIENTISHRSILEKDSD